MIDEFISINENIPSSEMDFKIEYIELFPEIEKSFKRLLSFKKLNTISKNKKELSKEGNNLYFKSPGLVNVLLNYKICMENGIVLNPRKYAEFSQKDSVAYNKDKIEQSHNLYLESILLLKCIYSLKDKSIEYLNDFKKKIPKELHNLTYASEKDKYTWMASYPKRVKNLADNIKKESKIDLIIGSAHGSIMPATLLSNMINSDLYFIRFSKFKRNDNNPIVSESDEEYLSDYKEKSILFFDEDLASGKTLQNLKNKFSPKFSNYHTAAVIRHYLAYNPDFVAENWFD